MHHENPDRDRNLIERLCEGIPSAWDEFLKDYGGVVYSTIVYTLKRSNFRIPEDEIPDIVQTLFERLLEDNCRRLKGFSGRGGCSLGGWLRTVCTNLTLETMRGRKKAVSLSELPEDWIHEILGQTMHPSESSAREILEEQECLDSMEKAIAELKPRDQLIYKLYYRDDRSRDEIAEICRIQPNHVDQILYRIRGRIQKLLGLSGEEESAES